MDLNFEGPMTAAVVPSMTQGSSLDIAAGMTGMLGQTSACPCVSQHSSSSGSGTVVIKWTMRAAHRVPCLLDQESAS